MNLCDIKTIEKLLSRHGFTFSKALGQNFIIDNTVCPEMVRQSGVDKSCAVLEIGPGIGVLTKELAAAAGYVAAIEVDKRLPDILNETLADFDNVKVINGDVMAINLHELIDEEFAAYSKVMVCANLPYYITSPVIMLLLESRLPIDSITVMVQKEAGERLAAAIPSRQSGAVSVAANYYAECEKLFDVPRESFVPSPKVDSCVIKLTLRQEAPVKVNSEKQFFALVKAAFAQRRKTAINSISSGLGVNKETLREIFSNGKIDENTRAERLTMEEMAFIANSIT